MSEGMSFDRYEVRRGVVVAVFRLDYPVADYGPMGEEGWTDESVFDRPSLRTRLGNLRADGRDGEATTAALADWPEG